MDSYRIIDEPKPKAYEHFILDPTIILFLGIFLPLFWAPPAMGKYWMPILWLLCNGYMLGSTSLKREILTAILGTIGFFGLLAGYDFLQQHYMQENAQQVIPYFKIGIQALFFFTLYMIVFQQSSSYAIHEYLRDQE